MFARQTLLGREPAVLANNVACLLLFILLNLAPGESPLLPTIRNNDDNVEDGDYAGGQGNLRNRVSRIPHKGRRLVLDEISTG